MQASVLCPDNGTIALCGHGFSEICTAMRCGACGEERSMACTMRRKADFKCDSVYYEAECKLCTLRWEGGAFGEDIVAQRVIKQHMAFSHSTPVINSQQWDVMPAVRRAMRRAQSDARQTSNVAVLTTSWNGSFAR